MTTEQAKQWLESHGIEVVGVTPTGVCVIEQYASKSGGYSQTVWLPASLNVLRNWMATIKGFADFDAKGFSAPMLDKIKRKDHPVYGVEYWPVIVELDAGHNWPFSGLYSEYPNEILKLNCTEGGNHD